MSFSLPLPASQTKDADWCIDEPTLSARLFEIGFLLRCWRARLRMGEVSRAPLRLLRFDVNGDGAECEWIARPPDPWDADLRPETGWRHASEQALRDAVAVRRLIFTLMPEVDRANLRVYRESEGQRELIIAGQAQRHGGFQPRCAPSCWGFALYVRTESCADLS
jgi:hypothetical protein